MVRLVVLSSSGRAERMDEAASLLVLLFATKEIKWSGVKVKENDFTWCMVHAKLY